ncbi:MAG: HupE/UreJ family protein [Opitutales bacterium]
MSVLRYLGVRTTPRLLPFTFYLSLLTFLVLPARADAHLVATGLGPVYDGAGHWLTSPEDFIPVLALAILAGLRGPAAGRWTLFLLPPAWLLGGIAGLLVTTPPGFSRPALSSIVAGTFLVPGLLALSDLTVPAAVVAGLAVLIGLIHGVLDAFGLRAEGITTAVGVLQFLGMAILLFILIPLFAAAVIATQQTWLRIVARVLGSWIAAAGILLLGWAINGNG